MSQTNIRTGGCHCGAVRYEVQLATPPDAPNQGLGDVLSCNCSICQKRGAYLVFVPAENFKLTGSDTVRDYQFGKKALHHLFCSVCGVGSYATGEGPGGVQMAAINVRCLDGVDAGALTLNHFDGKSL